MLALILPFLSSYWRYIAGAAAVVFVYFWWEHSIEQRALLEFNQSQLEQLLKDQKEFNQKLTDIKQVQDKILEDEKQFKQNLDKKLSGINNFLGSDEAKRLDRPASEILKKTLRDIAQ
jgi:uncharacterized protein HemX